MTNIVNRLYRDVNQAPATTIRIAFPKVIGWLIGRHVLYWGIVALTILSNDAPRHWLAAHPEARFADGEYWLAASTAYCIGVMIMQRQLKVGLSLHLRERERASTTLLYVLVPWPILLAWCTNFAICYTLFIPYAAYWLILTALRATLTISNARLQHMLDLT